MKKISILLVVLLLFSGCSYNKKVLEYKKFTDYKSKMSFHDSLDDSGNGVYCSAKYISFSKSGDGKVMIYYQGSKQLLQFDPRNGKVKSPCTDPVCTHEDADCKLFERNIVSISGVYDNVLYFTEPGNGIYRYMAYSYLNNSIEQIVELSNGVGSSPAIKISPDWFYFKTAYESTSENSTNGYEPAIIRVSRVSRKKEFVSFVESGTTFYCVTDNERLLFKGPDEEFYTTDMQYGDKTSITDNKFESSVESVFVSGKYVFYLGPVAMSKEAQTWYFNLFRTDMTTGETVRVVEENLYAAYVTEKYIYYQPFDWHEIGGTYTVTLPNGSTEEYPNMQSVSDTIYRADYNGNHAAAAWKSSSVYPDLWFVDGDYLYGLSMHFDEKSLSYTDESLRGICCDMINNTWRYVEE